MKFNRLIPELSVSDINASKEFYTKLGFRICYERPENKFAFIELDGCQIMIDEINGNWNTGKLEKPFGRGINLSMSVADPESYFNELKAKGIVFFKELMHNKYKCGEEEFDDCEFLVQDPDGYLLRFNS